MMKSIKIETLYTALFCMFAFSFSWHLLASTILLVLLMILWVFDRKISFREKIKMAFKDPWVLILISTYVISLAGLIYTSDMEHGLFLMGVSLSMLLHPIMFKSISTRTFSGKAIHNVLMSFVLGSLTSAIYCLVKSYIDYSLGDAYGVYGFFYTHLMEVPLSPGAYGNYLMMSIFVLLLYTFEEYKFVVVRKSKHKAIALFIMLFFFVMLYLLQAKASILALTLILGIFILYKLKKQFSTKIAVIIGFIGIAGSILFIKTGGLELLGNRFKGISISKDEFDKHSDSSTNLRLAAIHGSVNLIKENPVIGVGTGAVKSELVKFYKKNDYSSALEHKTDSHNQFLRSFAKNGIFGLVAILLTLLLPIIVALKQNSLLLFMFGINQVIMASTGDIMDNQPGIVFQAFAVCFLLFIATNYGAKVKQVKT